MNSYASCLACQCVCSLCLCPDWPRKPKQSQFLFPWWITLHCIETGRQSEGGEEGTRRRKKERKEGEVIRVCTIIIQLQDKWICFEATRMYKHTQPGLPFNTRFIVWTLTWLTPFPPPSPPPDFRALLVSLWPCVPTAAWSVEIILLARANVDSGFLGHSNCPLFNWLTLLIFHLFKYSTAPFPSVALTLWLSMSGYGYRWEKKIHMDLLQNCWILSCFTG